MPALIPAAQRLGQARADRLIQQADSESVAYAKRIGGDSSVRWSHQAGMLQGTVRNLCAELAAYDPEDGSVEVEWRGVHLWVHIRSEQIQANGCDISALLSQRDVEAIVCLAEERQREQWADDAAEVAFRRAA